MAIEIEQKGIEPEYTATCYECGSKLKAKRKDLKTEFTGFVNYWHAPCPVCTSVVTGWQASKETQDRLLKRLINSKHRE